MLCCWSPEILNIILNKGTYLFHFVLSLANCVTGLGQNNSQSGLRAPEDQVSGDAAFWEDLEGEEEA